MICCNQVIARNQQDLSGGFSGGVRGDFDIDLWF